MAARTVILLDEHDRALGSATVPDSVSLIRHDDRLFVRTSRGMRLSGGGIGIAFTETEVFERPKLGPK